MNKNVSVWRGSEAPPTTNHIWINEKKNNAIYLHNGSDWDPVVDPDAYETLLDYLRHKEDSPKIDVINEIPNGNDFKNGEFQLYKLGKDITVSSPECYEFGKTASFTIREGDLCLIGKIKHAPISLEAERPKFSDKYKYKIRFDANLDYYFGGTENIGEPVLTTTTQPLTYSLIGSEDKCIIKCGNYYAFISGERLCLTDQLSSATYFILHELEPNKFELLSYNNQSKGLNAHQGLYPWGTEGDYSDEIHLYNTGSPGNIVQFLPQESELIIRKIISTQEATTSYSGLMSKEDKAKLNSIASNANNYSLPAASSSTRGGIKIGYASSANNRAVQLSSEKAYVYIPNATTIQSGLMSKEDKVKLDTMTTEISNTYATKASLNNKVDKVSGKQLSSEDFTTALKTRLEGINVYKHAFNELSALPDNDDGWYSIINLGDMESAIVQISAGQSDTQVAVSAGWGGNDIGSLVVLNCTLDVNNNFAHIKAVRIRRHKANNNDANGYLMLEAKLNRTGYTNGYRNTVVSVFTNAGHNPIVIDSNATNVLQLNSSTSEILLQEFELADRTIMAKAIKVETINADNLANVATTGNYNDLNNKPTIPAAQVNSDWNAASGKAQILNKPTIPTNLSDLSSDTTHRTVTDTEKQTWNNKSNFSGSYNDLTNKPSIASTTTDGLMSASDKSLLDTTSQNLQTEIARAQKAENDLKNELSSLIGESPETLDTIHEIAAWILNDTTGAEAMAKQISENKAAINTETQRASYAETEIENELQYQTERIDEIEPLVAENGHSIIDLQHIVQDNDAVYKDTFQDLGNDIANEITRATEAENDLKQQFSDLIGESPETLDTIHEIAAWITNNESGAAAMATQINENKSNLTKEVERAKAAEQTLNSNLEKLIIQIQDLIARVEALENPGVVAEVSSNNLTFTNGAEVETNNLSLTGNNIDITNNNLNI